jgi:response regulator NasT
VGNLEEQLETRRFLDRAKGLLMDECGMKEGDAFSFIQKTAMERRQKMKAIAEAIIAGELRP